RRRELRFDRCDLKGTLKQVLRVGTELVARAAGVRPDHDFLPADPVLVVVVSIGNGGLSAQRRAGQDHLEPGRSQSRRTARTGKRSAERNEPGSSSAYRELGVSGDPHAVGTRVDVPGLEGRNLGQIE